jgi:hypothetical protein
MSAIAKNGGDKAIQRVCDIAVSRENIRLSVAAARALYLAGDKVNEQTAARLTVDQVTRRNEGVSVFMAQAIGACGTHAQIMETARALSALPKRRALLLPLAIGATRHEDALVREILALLPPDAEAAVLATFAGGAKLPRDALDGLGDVRITEEIFRRLRVLFEPKPK